MSHTHGSAASAHRSRLAGVFLLTLVVFVIELAGGIASNSLALLADAGHMLTSLRDWSLSAPVPSPGASRCVPSDSSASPSCSSPPTSGSRLFARS